MFWRKPLTIQQRIATLHRNLAANLKARRVLLRELELVQDQCPHPADKRVVVSAQQIDRVSCIECGKILEG